MDKLTIAERLKNLREQKNITREQAAKDLGISYSALSAYEIGDRTPRDRVKLRIAEYYGETVQAIFFNHQ